MALEASKFATEDVISSMPDNVVTHILDRLPVQDAVKTSSLSKKWRFKWTMLSQLVFDDNFIDYLTKTNGKSKCGRIICSLLLNLKGNITKFVLYIEEQCYGLVDDGDIAQWMLFLSKKGVKDLTICKMYGEPLKLSTHIFSCLELKHLKLFYCSCFSPPVSFHGFPNLLSLELCLVQFESSKFGEFITRCPLLEILNMRFQHRLLDSLRTHYQRMLLETTTKTDLLSVGKVKLVENAKLANLKILSLSLCHLDSTMIANSSSIFDLVRFLPKLQELDLDFEKCEFTEGGPEKRFPTTFSSLKTLKVSTIDLCNGIMLSCAFELIKSFPNLQTLEITTTSHRDVGPTPAICSPDLDYNSMELLQLQSVVFTYFKASENEVCLIKFLLAYSPFLKKIVIHPHSCLSLDEKLVYARKLLKLHRASPVIDIDVR
ncbi:putative F-box domain, FBD domain, leucine-rich repeat domain superfamily [Helianthus annuus]|nr:putative F-box domain, FBD domain, leucine-rich repeat domain superfamily [Helianthus annuus]